MDNLEFWGHVFAVRTRFAFVVGKPRCSDGAQVMFGNLPKRFQRLANELCRFSRTSSATTAVEFAFIGPPFLATLIGILEVAGFLLAQQVLQNAASEAGRLFMTGQEQNSFTQNNQTTTQQQLQQFQSDVCPMIRALFSCNSSSLMVNVKSYSDFSSADASEPTLTFDAHGNVTNTWSFAPGTPGQVMVVQLIYQWPIVGGPLGYVLSNLGNGSAEIMGVSAFRVEPYR